MPGVHKDQKNNREKLPIQLLLLMIASAASSLKYIKNASLNVDPPGSKGRSCNLMYSNPASSDR
jgi:hypothetical protein